MFEKSTTDNSNRSSNFAEVDISEDVKVAAQTRDNIIPGKVENLCPHKLCKSRFSGAS